MFKSYSIRTICLWAFVVRLISVCIITLFSSQMSLGLMGSTYEQDDVRYLAGAELYIESATSIVDFDALFKAFDEVEPWGTHDEKSVELWYYIICAGMYLLRSEFLLRLINVLFAVLSVKCIYDICILLYGRRIAQLASCLYSFLPYPVLFSCFLYKDQFYTLLTVIIIRKSIRCAGHISIYDLMQIIILLIVSMLTRTGLIVYVLTCVILIIIHQGKYKISIGTLLMFFSLLSIIIGYIIYISWEDIIYKITYYILDYYKEGDGIINYFTIKTPSQLYRYPLAFFFLLIQPLNYKLDLKTWMDIAGLLNIVGIPVALGNFYYFINIFKYRTKSFFYWLLQPFYFFTILTSLGIVRHHYFLLAFSVIFFSIYIYQSKRHYFLLCTSLSFMLCIVLSWFIYGCF